MLFTFSILHYNGGILEEGDKKVAGLQVGIQRQLWVVHHCTTDIQTQRQLHIIPAVKMPPTFFLITEKEDKYTSVVKKTEMLLNIDAEHFKLFKYNFTQYQY